MNLAYAYLSTAHIYHTGICNTHTEKTSQVHTRAHTLPCTHAHLLEHAHLRTRTWRPQLNGWFLVSCYPRSMRCGWELFVAQCGALWWVHCCHWFNEFFFQITLAVVVLCQSIENDYPETVPQRFFQLPSCYGVCQLKHIFFRKFGLTTKMLVCIRRACDLPFV